MNIKKESDIRFGQILSILGLVFLIYLVSRLIINLLPLLQEITANANDLSSLVSSLRSLGIEGALVVISLQAIQVITLVFPTLVVQSLAGLMYGVVYGVILSVIGYFFGNLIVMIIMRYFGKILADVFHIKPKQNDKHQLFSVNTLNNMKHPEYVSFLMFLIPGIPNGILPYIFAQSNVSLWRYLLSVVLAVIPGAALCTWFGDILAEQNWPAAIALGIFAVVLFLIIWFNRNKIFDKIAELTK